MLPLYHLAAAESGDPEVLRLLGLGEEALGRALGPLVGALNPELVVLAGAVPGGELQLASVRRAALESINVRNGVLRLAVSPFGQHASIVGAATLILRAIFGGRFDAREELAAAVWTRIEDARAARSAREEINARSGASA